MEDIIRIGKISTVNYAAGTASVIYTDRNNEVSPYFPFFSMAYEMPKVDDTVVVIMLQNSTTKGFILGVPFSGKKIPAENGQGIFYKAVTADSLTVKGEIKAKAITAVKIIAEDLEVSGTAKINNLEVSGTTTGYFPDK